VEAGVDLSLTKGLGTPAFELAAGWEGGKEGGV